MLRARPPLPKFPCDHDAHARGGAKSVAALVARLRDEGLRITKGRTLLLQTLISAERPLTIFEMMEQTQAMAGAPDLTTVFRLMVRLEKWGIVRRLYLSRAATYYQLNDAAHHREHVVCRECGKIAVLREECPVREIEARIALRYGFTEITHSLEFFGLCAACARH